MKTLMITAMHSGAGKTIMSCALLAAFQKRGLRLQAFKCGPDYIDPMFHRSVLGVPSRNLDLFLQGEEGVRRCLKHAEGDLAILEGAMGYYDGVNGTEEGSAWKIAALSGSVAVLVLRPKGSGLSLAAQVKGTLDFRPDSRIQGLLLADCTPDLASYLRHILERETGLPVLGFLPPMQEARVESRHLGLLTAAEIENLAGRIDRLAEQAQTSIDLDRLLALAEEYGGEQTQSGRPAARCHIAVARDEAFCFCYPDSLDALRDEGAELCFFSPLREHSLPAEMDGLYLPGGYPELHAQMLSENAGLRSEIAAAVTAGLPTVAECGGFLYLQEELEDPQGFSFPMCGVLPGRGFRTGQLQRFGYQLLSAEEDTMLFHAGEKIPAHEFHYWESTAPGTVFQSEKPNGRTWRCGYAGNSLYAAFPHLYFGGELPLAKRFVKACETWKTSMKS